MKYGLIGKTLKHSYSKIIHEQLLENYVYDLHPLAETELYEFMTNKKFCAINVTIPYKQKVIPYLDLVHPHAKKINAVNTIVNKKGKLCGYNTDYYGFLYMLKKHNIQIENKKVIILGDGGASKAVQAVVQDLHAQSMIIVNRTKKPYTVSLEETYENHDDAQIIINTTPCGMYPKTNETFINLIPFMRCEAVIDCIYNPIETRLIQQAKFLKIPTAVSGLEMLVAQAVKALEYFKDIQIPETKIDEVYKNILRQTTNLIVHGTNTEKYKKLASLLHKEFVQTMDTSYAYKTNQIIQVKSIESLDWNQNGWILEDDEIETMIQTYNELINQL